MPILHDNQNPIMCFIGKVISVDDESDGMRIKAFISGDLANNIPYAFPLLPKMFQVRPKVGEAVMVFLSKLNDRRSDRFYVGPIVSQPQFLQNAQYESSLSLFKDKILQPLESIKKEDGITKGAFPPEDNVSLVGRDSEDLSMGNGTVILRAGARKAMDNMDNKSLIGNVAFDNDKASFIMLRKKDGLIPDTVENTDNGADSVAVIAADKFAFMSKKQKDASFEKYDNESMIKDEDFDKIMQKLHQIPYGDKLVEVLKDMRSAISNHVHPWAGLPPCNDETVKRMNEYNLDDILSKNARIS
jgi:hypothetical protein